MAAITQPWSALSALTIALNSLADATYVAASAVDLSAVDPEDLLIEVAITPGTVASEKAVSVFLQVSFDGTNYSTGPASGTTATDEPNLYLLGKVPCNTNAVLQRKSFPVLAALGFVPQWFKVVCKNSTGAALAASGNSASYATLTGNV